MKSRKQVIRYFIGFFVMSGLLISGCNNEVLSSGSVTGGVRSDATAENRDGGKDSSMVLEIIWQQGGSGEYLTPTIDKFKKQYPGYNIKIDYSVKAHDVIRPRLVAGNPPDIFMVHQSFFDHYGAIKAGQLVSIDDILQTKMPDSNNTLENIFQEDSLKLGYVNGKHYLFPDQHYINGFWYSGKLFSQKGWTPPKNWDEFVAFCKEVKSSGEGIIPFGYAGLNAPFYLSDSFILPSIAHLGGKQTIDDLNNLKPGVWKSQPVTDTMKRIRMLVDEGYLYDGSLEVNHTQLQTMFIENKIAMIPVGSWLESEMKGNWPSDFMLTAIAPPLGNGSSNFMVAYNTLIAIPERAKNKAIAKEFMKLFYTKDVMKKVANDYQSLFPVKDNVKYADGVLPESVVHIFSVASQPDMHIISHPWTYWYKTLDKKYQDSITAVVARDITPEKFGEEMEKEADNIRQDNSIPKYTVD